MTSDFHISSIPSCAARNKDNDSGTKEEIKKPRHNRHGKEVKNPTKKSPGLSTGVSSVSKDQSAAGTLTWTRRDGAAVWRRWSTSFSSRDGTDSFDIFGLSTGGFFVFCLQTFSGEKKSDPVHPSARFDRFCTAGFPKDFPGALSFALCLYSTKRRFYFRKFYIKFSYK